MKRIIVAALFSASVLFAVPAQAVIVQQTYTGTVGDFSFDIAGIFGPVGAGPTSLTGKPFTASFKFDTSAGNTTTITNRYAMRCSTL